MALPRVAPGQPLAQSPLRSARVVNTVLAAAEHFAAQQSGGFPRMPPEPLGQIVVRARNMAGEDLARGEVVQLSSPLLDQLDPRRPWFEADLPADPPSRFLGIYQQPVKDGKIGPVCTHGLCIAKVDVTSADHTHARVTEGDFMLTSGFGGPFEFLAAPADVSEQEIWGVLSRPNGPIRGKANANINDGATGACSVWVGAGGSETDSDVDIEDCANESGINITSGDWVWIEFSWEGYPYVVPGRCESA